MDFLWLKSEETLGSTIMVDCNSVAQTIKLAVCLKQEEMFPNGIIVPIEDLSPTISKYDDREVSYYYSEECMKTFKFSDLISLEPDTNNYQTWLISRPVHPSGKFIHPFTLTDPINLHRITYSNKLPNYTTPYYNEVPVGFFNRPLHNSTFDDCSILVAASHLLLFGDVTDVVEHDRTLMTDLDVRNLRVSKFPKVLLSASGQLTPTNSVEVEAQLADSNDDPISCSLDFYFENINGQISHTRRTTSAQGYTSIKVAAPLLEAGDSVRIKVGVKYFSGINDITLPVYMDV